MLRYQLARFLGLCVAAAVLSGCVAEENDGRRFANDLEPSVAVALPSPSGIDGSPAAGLPSVVTPAATPIDPTALLRARGGPSRLYFRLNSDVWTIGAADDDPRRVFAPDRGLAIVDHAASPNGDRVAVLMINVDDRSASAVAIVDANGKETGRVEGLGEALGEGSFAARAIDWSPQADRLLVAFEPGGIVALNSDGSGEPTPLVGPEAAAAVGDAAWSPTGESIAFVAPADSDEVASLWLARTAPEPGAPTLLLDPGDSGRSVGVLAWSPDGREVLFTLPAAPGSPNSGGDLWTIGVDGAGRRVVAGAGAVGFPGALVGEMAPSPDGDAVAYTVVVPDQEGLRFNSLWVKERAEPGRSLELAVPDEQAVDALWWTDAGLVFRTVPMEEFAAERDGSYALYRAGLPGSEPERLFAEGGAGAATPVGDGGSPVPEASPRR